MTDSLEAQIAEQRAKLEGHEDTCAARYKSIGDSLDALWRRNGRIEVAAWAIVISLLGFLAVKFIDDRDRRVEALEPPVLTTAAPTAIARPLRAAD